MALTGFTGLAAATNPPPTAVNSTVAPDVHAPADSAPAEEQVPSDDYFSRSDEITPADDGGAPNVMSGGS